MAIRAVARVLRRETTREGYGSGDGEARADWVGRPIGMVVNEGLGSGQMRGIGGGDWPTGKGRRRGEAKEGVVGNCWDFFFTCFIVFFCLISFLFFV